MHLCCNTFRLRVRTCVYGLKGHIDVNGTAAHAYISRMCVTTTKPMRCAWCGPANVHCILAIITVEVVVVVVGIVSLWLTRCVLCALPEDFFRGS